MSSESKSLGSLPVGATAVIEHITGERTVTRRLMEMGVLPGTRVRVARVAPLGDPIELHLRGYSLSIRRADARAVQVVDVRLSDDAKVAGRA